MTGPPPAHALQPPFAAVAIIPARGGSKGLIGKNLCEVGGRSLIRRAIESCSSALGDGAVFVSTDDLAIAAEAESAGASVIHRPESLGSDTASSESVLLHGLGELDRTGIECDVLVFVQCTSPFISPTSIRNAVERIGRGEADSIFSVIETHDFVWRLGSDGGITGANHEESHRERRQDRVPEVVETGAFYVMSVNGFVEAEHRFFGTLGVEVVDRWQRTEIDDLDDLTIAQALSLRFEMDVGKSDFEGRLSSLEVLVTDFDGVHTDDSVWVLDDGSEAIRASRSDGFGIEQIRSLGVKVLILSREKNTVVMRRAEKLDVECIHGADRKWPILERWLKTHDIDPQNVAYVGNDVNDAECLRNVGLPIAVSDAHRDVIPLCAMVLSRPGGHGAIRELTDKILRSRATESEARE